MSANETGTCGECRWALAYEGSDGSDPFLFVDKERREDERRHNCVCNFDKEWPMVMDKGTRPEDVPCDFWEPR